MPRARKPRYIDPDLNFRHGVRRDGVEWMTITHPNSPKVVRLCTPHDPEYGKVQVAFTDWCAARKAQPFKLGWKEPA